VNLDVRQGEIMGILGPSGAGKSSVFRVLTMAMRRDGGKVALMDTDFDQPDAANVLTTGKIGIVFQEDVLWPELSVDRHLWTMGRLKGMDEDSIES
jgi:ABC-type multidrug transport system ATPase subunit